VTNVVWLAAHAADPIDDRRISAWLAAVEAAFSIRLTGLRRSALVARHTCLVAWSDPANVPRTWSQVEERPDCLAVSDGYPIGFEQLGLIVPRPSAVVEALDGDPSLIDALLPPYAGVLLRDGRLSLAIDALGFAKVYTTSTPGTTVWSSSAMLASLFAHGRADVADEAWIGLIAQDAFLGDDAPLANVRLERPRTIVRAVGAPGGLRIERSDPIAPLFHHEPENDVAGAVTDALRRVYRSIGRLDVGPLTVPLSGGRDSRLLAAVGLGSGAVDALWTSSPPEQDVDIARSLIARLHRPVPWSVRDKAGDTRQRDASAVAAGLTVPAIWDRLVAHQLSVEGEGIVTPHTSPRAPRASLEGATLWGIGGEFGRAYSYDARALARPDAATTWFWRAKARRASLIEPLVAREIIGRRLDAIRADFEDAGLHGLRQLDAQYVFGRVRRLQNRIGTTTGIRPFFTLPYLRATLPLPPSERARTTYHADIVRRTMPAWADVPFSHATRPTIRSEATQTSYAEAFWDGPFVAELSRDLLEALAGQDAVRSDRVAELLARAGRRDGGALARMRAFERLLGYVSYGRHVEVVVRDFRAAGGRAAVGDPHPVGAVSPSVATAPQPHPSTLAIITARAAWRLDGWWAALHRVLARVLRSRLVWLG
jgi:asparagine synthase (glutamine-hydrolysing)